MRAGPFDQLVSLSCEAPARPMRPPPRPRNRPTRAELLLLRRRILQALCERHDTRNDIAEAIGIERRRVWRALAELCSDGLVARTGRAGGSIHFVITEQGFALLQKGTPA